MSDDLTQEEKELLCRIFLAFKAAWLAQGEEQTRTVFMHGLSLLPAFKEMMEKRE